MDYLLHLAILVCIYMILAHSFNLVFGLGLLINLAHIAVYAIGAYTTALLSTEAGYGTVSCLLLSGVFAAVFALLIGGISLKLSQDYFAVGTLAFSSVVSALLINWKSLTRGVLGIPGIPRPELFQADFYNNRIFLYMMLVLVAVTLTSMYFIFRSPFSRSLRALAEYELAAQALGKNTRWVRTLSFMLSSFFAGVAGGTFAYYINYIDPSSFSLSEMIFVFTIIIVGRPGSFWGVTISTIFLVLLPEPLRFLDIPPSILGPMRQMIYALILFTTVYINRARIFPVKRTI